MGQNLLSYCYKSGITLLKREELPPSKSRLRPFVSANGFSFFWKTQLLISEIQMHLTQAHMHKYFSSTCCMENHMQGRAAGSGAGQAIRVKDSALDPQLDHREHDGNDVQRLVGEKATPVTYCSILCQRVN